MVVIKQSVTLSATDKINKINEIKTNFWYCHKFTDCSKYDKHLSCHMSQFNTLLTNT